MAYSSARLGHAIDHWFTTAEWGSDVRTGALVNLKERERTRDDRRGRGSYVWDWVVWDTAGGPEHTVGRGIAPTQVAARAAARKVVRAMPDKPKP